MAEDLKDARQRLQRLLREALTLTQALRQPKNVRDAAASYDPASVRFRVEHYPHTRFWALYEGDELFAVTVYKRGAETVRDRLQALEARLAEHARGQGEDGQERAGAVGRLQAERERDRGPGAHRSR